MSEADWINIASGALLLCAELLQKIDRLKEQLQSLREKLQEKDTTHCINMDQLLQCIKPTEFSSYEEFIQALLIGLSNRDMTFDQLNYKL